MRREVVDDEIVLASRSSCSTGTLLLSLQHHNSEAVVGGVGRQKTLMTRVDIARGKGYVQSDGDQNTRGLLAKCFFHDKKPDRTSTEKKKRERHWSGLVY